MAVRPSELVRPVHAWLIRLQLPLVVGGVALGAAALVGALPGRVAPGADLLPLAWPLAILGGAAPTVQARAAARA